MTNLFIYFSNSHMFGRFLRFLGIFTIGLILISLLNFWQASRPPRIAISGTPADYGLTFEEAEITGVDGIKLSGWYIPAAEEGLPVVILLHGYPAEKADMLRIAEKLHPHFSLLLLDLRYFGASEGLATTLGVKEPGDIQAAIRFLQDKNYEQIGIFGFSFGGAVALLTAATDSGVAAVGSYASYADLRQLGRELFFVLPGVKYPLVEFMNVWAGLFFGGFPMDFSPYEAAQELNIPVLIIHSKEDEQISFSHAEKLQESLKHNEQAEFIFLEEGRHGVLPPDFYERLIDFFNK